MTALPSPPKFTSIEEVRRHLAKRREQGLSLGLDMEAQRRFVAEHVGGAGPVLDIGTGKGHMAAALARVAPPVISIDPSPEDRYFAGVTIADAGVSDRVARVQGTGERLPFADGIFTAVVSHLALHHFENPSVTLREMLRVLRASGTLIVSDFDAAGFDVLEAIHQSEGGHHSVAGWPVDRAAEFLADLGCDVRAEDGPMVVAAVAVKG